MVYSLYVAQATNKNKAGYTITKPTKKSTPVNKKATISSLNTGMGNVNPKTIVNKKTKKRTVKKVASATTTNSTNSVNATNTNKAQGTTAKVPCTLNSSFAVTSVHNTFVNAVNTALTALHTTGSNKGKPVIPTLQVQLTNNAINWAVNSSTGKPNCRIGGFYLYNGVLQLQCRWLQASAITYIKGINGLTIVNATHTLAKSNNLQLPVLNNHGTLNTASVNCAVAILKLQASAYQQGKFINVNSLVG